MVQKISSDLRSYRNEKLTKRKVRSKNYAMK